jgi:hypothetical protein
MEREDPVPLQVHLAVNAIGCDLEHPVDLEHLLDRKVDLREIVTAIDRQRHNLLNRR